MLCPVQGDLMRIPIVILLSCTVLLSAGCFGASTNPREGGLFGYSPEAYEARQQERQARLEAIRQEQARENAAQAELEQKKQLKLAQVSKQKQEMAALSTEIDRLSGKVSSLKQGNRQQQEGAAALEQRQKNLQKANSALQTQPDSAAKQQKLLQLREELRQLEEEAEYLSNL